jgi:hypothetical protein
MINGEIVVAENRLGDIVGLLARCCCGLVAITSYDAGATDLQVVSFVANNGPHMDETKESIKELCQDWEFTVTFKTEEVLK